MVKHIFAHIDDSDKERFKEIVKLNKQTQSDVVRKLVKDYIKVNEHLLNSGGINPELIKEKEEKIEGKNELEPASHPPRFLTKLERKAEKEIEEKKYSMFTDELISL